MGIFKMAGRVVCMVLALVVLASANLDSVWPKPSKMDCKSSSTAQVLDGKFRIEVAK